MKDKRFIYGISISFLWIVIAGIFLKFNETPTKLNEWGDVFAGFFTPLGFLWLVLGYMQQGEELKFQATEIKHSSDALKRQVEEQEKLVQATTDQVREQAKLVEVSRTQMNLQIKAIEDEAARRKFQAQPRFEARYVGQAAADPHIYYQLELKNYGRPVSNVTIENNATKRLDLIKDFGPSEAFSDAIKYQGGGDFELRISYTDADGNFGNTTIPYKMGIHEIEVTNPKLAVPPKENWVPPVAPEKKVATP